MLAVVVHNDFAVLTLASIRKNLPGVDPYLIHCDFHSQAVDRFTEGWHDKRRDIHLRAFDIPSMVKELQDRTKERMLCIEGGMLVLRDPKPFLPKDERFAPYTMALSRDLMYSRQMGTLKNYAAIDIPTKDDQNPRVSYHDLSKPHDNTKVMHLGTALRFGHDFLTTRFFNASESLRHSYTALNGSVIDFLEQVLDPNLETFSLYATPADVYGEYAETVAHLLPEEAMKAIRRNARRAKILAPSRALFRPYS